jgi:GPH family glycoside/pentoside/hexuronide:cation symporter
MNDHPEQPDKEVSAKELTLYSLPEGANFLSGRVMTNMLHPILVTTVGLAPSLVGLLMMVRTLWDAFTDPAMGYISDNAKFKMGRRRPYILIGGILMAVTMGLAFRFSESWDHDTIALYFGVMLMLFASAQTIFLVPYGALGLELSLTYNGRTRIQVARTLASRIVSFAYPFLFPFCLLPVFGGAMVGVRWLSIILALFIAVSVILAAFGTRERMQASAAKDNFFKAIIQTCKSRNFLRIAFIYAVLCGVLSAVEVFNYYMSVYYVFRGDIPKGASFYAAVETLANVLTLAAVPAVGWVCNKYGKHNALRMALGMMILGSWFQMVLMNPEHPWLLFVYPFFYSTGIVATFMVLSAMLADVVDADEIATHKRREGLFSATAAFMMKTVSAIGAGFSGYLIEWSGFVADLGGNQADGVFGRMRMIYIYKSIPLILCLFVLYKYPLTKVRLKEIQNELRRRGEFPDTEDVGPYENSFEADLLGNKG